MAGWLAGWPLHAEMAGWLPGQLAYLAGEGCHLGSKLLHFNGRHSRSSSCCCCCTTAARSAAAGAQHARRSRVAGPRLLAQRRCGTGWVASLAVGIKPVQKQQAESGSSQEGGSEGQR